ncbi:MULTISPECIES: RNA polymerase sigma factor [unclassified Chitinophaga]|uniref:RNA polymerase sigma factor n=1 Tax=unclassified Chitinophaga TaxID=2619133 RepID=UPI0009C6BCE0|nr:MULTISPECIES: hypothetical protein [unclassified Chitinophaga]OMP76790.1 hypothetical protein BW716_22950 [[Flexibacter] sp. ATCC 35208]WPV65240.1 hypothetical protein QQL36_25880 [Chitinophaga sp. LS1]
MKEFRYQSKLNTWIGGIAYKTCLKYLERRHLEFVSADLMEEENEIMDNGNATKAMTQKELAGILKEVIDQLSPIFRTLIILLIHPL